MKKVARKNRTSVVLIFTALVFLVLVVTLVLASVIVSLMIRAGVISSYADLPSSLTSIVFYMFLISLILGSLVAFAFSHIPLKPVNRIINNMNRLASGDFKVRMRVKKPLSNLSAVVELSESFNKMAQELEQTRLLRTDFINNFSHEFKTPIVSIAGFAKLLKRGDLDEDEKNRYIEVIEEESLRLAEMATNMLNLSKVENSQMPGEIKKYNLSEQIRSCVLLLEKKWEQKRLDMDIDFEEYYIEAGEELLKQAWINLIDNAVKFSPAEGRVSVRINDEENFIAVEISNTGSGIAKENLKKIFNKFYQEDESHAGKGNGIGLAIVDKVISLHNGTVEAQSERGLTTFTVRLPKKR